MPRMQVTAEFLRGYIEGLEAFAWMLDGTTYVGSCGTTLKQAVADAHKRYEVINPKDDQR